MANTAVRMFWPLAHARHLPAHAAQFVAQALAWAEVHTGLPAIVVAAIVLVVGFKLFKRSLRFAVEVAVVVGVLGIASALGWVRF